MKTSYIKACYQLTKPKVTYGNVLTTAAGYLFASNGNINLSTFVSTVIGTTLIIASACALNNYYDQDIDGVMERTKDRPLVTGAISSRGAVWLSLALSFVGGAVLLSFVNSLVFIIGTFGFIVYVYLYGNWSKRKSVHGTLVGAVSGAVPILAGYMAAVPKLDTIGLVLFAIMFFWQMPAFYSIAIFRRKEYRAADVPVISIVRGVKNTKKEIIMYLGIYTLFTVMLSIVSYTSITYITIVTVSGIYWLSIGLKSFRNINDDIWARRMFRLSLANLVIFSSLISFNAWLY